MDASAPMLMTKEQIKTAAQVESVTIPSPGEFFAAMDKQGQPNWTQLFQPVQPGSTSSRAQMALMLGVLVADGYIAVQAQDGQGVKNTGREIINLAKKLNVSQSILGRGNSISDFATNNDWSALREELEATQNEVKLAMAEQQDQNLVSLVTLGAWIRGTSVASGFVSKNYAPAMADLLRQPAIISDLLARINALPEAMLTTPPIDSLGRGLEKSEKIVSPAPSTPLSQESVNDLNAIMSGMVTSIMEGEKNP